MINITMSILWYSITISLQNSQVIFNGKFSVDNTTTLVQNFYDNSNPGTNILGPTTFPPPLGFYQADNEFDTSTLLFMINGINFTSSNLQNTLAATYPYFNIYGYNNTNTLWQLGNIISTIIIQPINSVKQINTVKHLCCSLFTNNSLVYYKSHSLSSGGGGSGVRNYRKKQRKT